MLPAIFVSISCLADLLARAMLPAIPISVDDASAFTAIILSLLLDVDHTIALMQRRQESARERASSRLISSKQR